MAFLNFPSNPSTGAVYTGTNGVTYNYDGSKWIGTGATIIAGGGASVTAGDNPPVGVSTGSLWYDDIGGRLYIYYDGGWTDAAPSIPGTNGLDGYTTTSTLVSGSAIVSLSSTGTLTSVGPLRIENGDDNAGSNHWPQISLTYSGTGNYAHEIRTRHSDSTGYGNAIDFYTNLDTASAVNPKKLGLTIENGKVGINGVTNPTGILQVRSSAGDYVFDNAGVLTFPHGDYIQNGRWYSNTATAQIGLAKSTANFVANIGISATGGQVTINSTESTSSNLAQMVLSGHLGQVSIFTSNGSNNPIWTFSNTGTLTAPGHIVPDTDVTYDLGSATNRFRDLYLSSSTIYLGSTLISATPTGGLNIPGGVSSGGALVGFDPVDGVYSVTADKKTIIFNTPWDPNWTLDPVLTDGLADMGHDVYEPSKSIGLEATLSVDKTGTAINRITVVSGGEGYSPYVDYGMWWLYPDPAEQMTITQVADPALYDPSSFYFLTLDGTTGSAQHTATGTFNGYNWSIVYTLHDNGGGNYIIDPAQTTVTCNSSSTFPAQALRGLYNEYAFYIHQGDLTALTIVPPADMYERTLMIIPKYNKGWVYGYGTAELISVLPLVSSSAAGVQGSSNVVGNLTVSGNVTQGATTVTDNLTVSGHVLPNADLAYDLGSSSTQWRSLYVGTSTIYLGGTALSVAGGTVTVDGQPVQGGGGGGDTIQNGSNTLTVGGDGVLRSTVQSLDLRDVSGAGFYTDTPGFVLRSNGISNWIFGIDASLSLPNNATIKPYGTTDANQVLKITPTAGGEGNHLHLTSGDLSVTSIFLGNDSQYVRTVADGNIIIGTNDTVPDDIATTGKRWIFGTDGRLTLPRTVGSTDPSILQSTGSIVLLAGDSPAYYFGTNGQLSLPGNLHFSDGSLQTTAWNDAAFMASMATYDGEIVTTTATVGAGGLTVNGPVTFNGPFTFQSTATTQVTGNTGTFYGDVNGVGALYAGIAGYSPLPATVLQASANINGYIQNNFQNIDHGTQASTEWVATNDTGNDSNNYIDVGIAGHGWDGSQSNSVGTAAGASDSWVYAQGTTSTSEGGNLVLGTIKNGKAVKILAGSTGSSSIVATFSSSGLDFGTTSSAKVTLPGGAYIWSNPGAANRNGSINLVPNTAAGTFAGVMIGGAGRILSPGGSVNLIIGDAAITVQAPISSIVGNPSTSASSGAMSMSGGIGVGADSFFGSSIKVAGTLTSTSTTTGAVVVTGGVAVGKDMYVGGQLYQPNRPAFRVIGNLVGTAITTGTTLTNALYVVDYQQGTMLNTATGIVTVPYTGLYQVNLNMRTFNNSNSGINQAIVQRLAGTLTSTLLMIEFAANTTMNHAGVGTVARLNAGDTVRAYVGVGALTFDFNDNWSMVFLG